MRQSGIVNVACLVTSLLCLLASESAIADQLELHLRLADAKTGAVAIKTERIDPAKCGVVIVDMWNYHWCMTAGERVRAMTPRMNRALEGARKLGMKVIWAPTDVADLYLGKPQRERAMAAGDKPILRLRSLPWHGTLGGGCLCGPGISCETNWGWDGMQPDLVIADQDYIVGADADGMYALCEKLGLSHLIYMGVHTNMCVLGKGPAIKNMYDAGFACILARDLTDALTHYDPQAGFTPDDGTARVVSDLERSDVPSINMAEEMKAVGVWNSDTPTEAVRITPWGTERYPYQFRKAPDDGNALDPADERGGNPIHARRPRADRRIIALQEANHRRFDDDAPRGGVSRRPQCKSAEPRVLLQAARCAAGAGHFARCLKAARISVRTRWAALASEDQSSARRRSAGDSRKDL